jgi:hypothetical protein
MFRAKSWRDQLVLARTHHHATRALDDVRAPVRKQGRQLASQLRATARNRRADALRVA